MYEVKRVEAQSLHSEMKTFAFESSPDFRHGLQSGYSVKKTFFSTPILRSITPDANVVRDRSEITLGFSMYDTPRQRRKRAFSYYISATVLNTLHVLSDEKRQLISPKKLLKYDNLEEIDEGALTEEYLVQFGTSDAELREMDTRQGYRLRYQGRKLYGNYSENILYNFSGEEIKVPAIESDDNSHSLFVPDHIEYDRLPEVDECAASFGFWDIVKDIQEEFEQGVTYRSAANQIRDIIHALRYGYRGPIG